MVDKTSDNPLDKLVKLTKQERRVLELRCKGLDYKTIATTLGIKVPSVKEYMQRIYVKLGIDILPPAERMKTIYQVYCPLLQSAELLPERPEDEVVEGTFEPIPPEVVIMVDDDEYQIVSVKPQPLTPPIIDKSKKPRWALIWVTLALIFGMCVGGVTVFAVLQANPGINIPFIPQATFTATPTFTPLPTSTTIPSPTVELPTQTSVFVEKIVVVTATPPPSTPLPTETAIPLVTLPFEDTFDLRAKSEWEISTGNWRVLDGHFTAENNRDWQVAFIGDPNWRNYKIEITTFFTAGFIDPIRIIVRANKDGYIAFEYDAGDARWLLVNGGNEKQIAEVETDFDGNKTYKMAVEVRDDIFIAYANGIQLSQIQDTTYSKGRVGISYQSSQLTWFDDFRVTELP